MRERLRRHIGELPKPLRAGPVSEPIERELGTAYNVDYRELLKALESDRYYRLLDGLEQFRDHPPTKARASRPARKEAAGLVNKTAKRLDRAHKAAARAKAGGCPGHRTPPGPQGRQTAAARRRIRHRNPRKTRPQDLP